LASIFGLLASYAGIISVVLVVLLLALAWFTLGLMRRLRALELHYGRLIDGADAGTQEGGLRGVLDGHMSELRSAICEIRELDSRTARLEQDSSKYLQYIDVRRYNPFRETGGDQSFVLTLTDANGNGTIITSMHSRDVTRVYAKPITSWLSQYALSDEEMESVRKGRGE
jgi:hypothetical protein